MTDEFKKAREKTGKEAVITFKTGWGCPDVAPTETIVVISNQAFDAGARFAHNEILNSAEMKGLIEAVEEKQKCGCAECTSRQF
ncbi:MAG: hypothetical protein ACK58T_42615, partial [Phycisphaerae bacterium]